MNPDEWFNAARDGDDTRVAELLARQPDLIDLVDENKANALHHAALSGHETVVAQLLAARPALINAKDVSGETPLDVAASNGETATVAQMLATNVACVGSITKGLYRAFKRDHDEVTTLLLDVRPPLIDATDPYAVKTIFYAIEENCETLVSQLLAACPDLADAVETMGASVLHGAAVSGSASMVDQILAARPELISAVYQGGWNALMSAVVEGRQHIAEKLLDRRPELIFQVANGGDTVLHMAVSRCRDPQFVAKLWRLNPQALTHANAQFETPFYVAVQHREEQLIDLFQWSLSFDTIVKTFTKSRVSYQERYGPLMEQECASLFEQMNPDVVSVVFEFLGLETARCFKRARHS